MNPFAIILISIFFILSGCSSSGKNKTNQSSSTVISENKIQDSRDGKFYKTINIGNQKWLTENLNFELPNSFCYSNKNENCEKHGRLYNYKEAMVACPKGWKLPSDTDWKILEQELGMSKVEQDSFRAYRGLEEGEKLKEVGQFNAKLSGFGKINGQGFQGKNAIVRFWTSSKGPSGEHFSIYRQLAKGNKKIYSDQAHFGHLCCVRCIEE